MKFKIIQIFKKKCKSVYFLKWTFKNYHFGYILQKGITTYFSLRKLLITTFLISINKHDIIFLILTNMTQISFIIV